MYMLQVLYLKDKNAMALELSSNSHKKQEKFQMLVTAAQVGWQETTAVKMAGMNRVTECKDFPEIKKESL